MGRARNMDCSHPHSRFLSLSPPLLSTPLLGKTDDRGGAEIAAEDMIRRRDAVGGLSSSVLSRYKMIT